jgi:hypothetical protein
MKMIPGLWMRSFRHIKVDTISKSNQNLKINSHALRIINDVLEDGNDSRMWKFVPRVLPATLEYMKTVSNFKYFIYSFIR